MNSSACDKTLGVWIDTIIPTSWVTNACHITKSMCLILGFSIHSQSINGLRNTQPGRNGQLAVIFKVSSDGFNEFIGVHYSKRLIQGLRMWLPWLVSTFWSSYTLYGLNCSEDINHIYIYCLLFLCNYKTWAVQVLSHRGRVTHICVRKARHPWFR